MFPLRATALALALPLAATARAEPGSSPEPAPAVNAAPPKVWIFCGTPGDDEHHAAFEKLLDRLRKALTTRFEIAPSDITTLYGPVDAGYDGTCTREHLSGEMNRIVAQTQSPNAAPVWIIFVGHSNAIAGGAFYNLPGPDISTHDLGEALGKAKPGAPIVVLATTACGGAFLRPLSASGRVVIASTSGDDIENETEYPYALADVLESPAADKNKDGILSATEVFLATHERVRAIYEEKNLMMREHSQLDGNGDGRGTQRPADADAKPAALIGLPLKTGTAPGKFD